MASLNLNQVEFTKNPDQIQSNDGIFNPKNLTVNTLNGADKIIGSDSVSGDIGIGVLIDITAENLDSAIVSAEFRHRANIATDGIKNKGIINTGKGADKVVGINTTNLSAIATIGSQAIAFAETVDTSVITNVFASIELNATTDGIDNSGGEIHTGDGSDHIYGVADGFISAVATAYADASAIVGTVSQGDISESLTTFAEAMATSLAQAKIIARGINNTKGTITTDKGEDTISARATSSAATFAGTYASTFASAAPKNQALAQVVTNTFAEAEDRAIAIDNTRGFISTGKGSDLIEAIAEARNKAIAIDNTRGFITTGDGKDTIIAHATGNESYGIFGGIIDMGDQDDRLEASSFGGGVNIKIGKGNDFVQGFGNATVDGGEGYDQLSFGAYKIEDFHISLGANNNQVIFDLDGITMTSTRFEQFSFDNGNLTLKYADLLLL